MCLRNSYYSMLVLHKQSIKLLCYVAHCCSQLYDFKYNMFHFAFSPPFFFSFLAVYLFLLQNVHRIYHHIIIEFIWLLVTAFNVFSYKLCLEKHYEDFILVRFRLAYMQYVWNEIIFFFYFCCYFCSVLKQSMLVNMKIEWTVAM